MPNNIKREVAEAKTFFKPHVPRYSAVIAAHAPELLPAFHKGVKNGEVQIPQLRVLGTKYFRFTPNEQNQHHAALRRASAILRKNGVGSAVKYLETKKRPVISRRFATAAALTLAAGIAGVSALKTTLPLFVKPESIASPANPEVLKRRLKEQSSVFRLNKDVNSFLDNLRRTGELTTADDVSLVVHDLTNNRLLLSINPDQPRRAASLIKPFIMLAAYHKLSEGSTGYPKLDSDIEKMIVKSDNDASRRVLRFVGGPVEATRIVATYGFKQTRVAEYIPHNGQAYENKTSASDLNQLLRALHNSALVTPSYSQAMLGHLDRYNTSRLADLPEAHDVDLAGKTGYIHGTQGEATQVLMKSGSTRYNFVLVLEGPHPKEVKYDRWEWWKRTNKVIRDTFRFVHNKVASGT